MLRIFNLAMKMEIGRWSKKRENWIILKYDPEIRKGSENQEIPNLWGRVDSYEKCCDPSSEMSQRDHSDELNKMVQMRGYNIWFR